MVKCIGKILLKYYEKNIILNNYKIEIISIVIIININIIFNINNGL